MKRLFMVKVTIEPDHMYAWMIIDLYLIIIEQKKKRKNV